MDKMINAKPFSAVASQPCSSGRITADKRFCYATPKLTSGTFLSEKCYFLKLSSETCFISNLLPAVTYNILNP